MEYDPAKIEAALAEVHAPEPLRAAVADAVAGARSGRPARASRRAALRSRVRLVAARPRLLAVASGALALVVVLVVALSGGSGSTPTVQDAARVALRPATAAAPLARPGGRELAAAVDGIAYPTWTRIGWHATGARADMLAGRRVDAVFYADAHGARIGYAIATGDALPVSGGRVVERRGARLRVLTVAGATVVTWRRDGHTCILAGSGVDVDRLLTLASYAT